MENLVSCVAVRLRGFLSRVGPVGGLVVLACSCGFSVGLAASSDWDAVARLVRGQEVVVTVTGLRAGTYQGPLVSADQAGLEVRVDHQVERLQRETVARVQLVRAASRQRPTVIGAVVGGLLGALWARGQHDLNGGFRFGVVVGGAAAGAAMGHLLGPRETLVTVYRRSGRD